jgi:hypothetical protein
VYSGKYRSRGTLGSLALKRSICEGGEGGESQNRGRKEGERRTLLRKRMMDVRCVPGNTSSQSPIPHRHTGRREMTSERENHAPKTTSS